MFIYYYNGVNIINVLYYKNIKYVYYMQYFCLSCCAHIYIVSLVDHTYVWCVNKKYVSRKYDYKCEFFWSIIFLQIQVFTIFKEYFTIDKYRIIMYLKQKLFELFWANKKKTLLKNLLTQLLISVFKYFFLH